MSFLLSNFIELGNDELRKVNGGAASCGGGGTSGSGSGNSGNGSGSSENKSGTGNTGNYSGKNSGTGNTSSLSGGSGSCGGGSSGGSGSSGGGSGGNGGNQSTGDISGKNNGNSNNSGMTGFAGNCSGSSGGTGSSGGSSGSNGGNGSTGDISGKNNGNNNNPGMTGFAGNCSGSYDGNDSFGKNNGNNTGNTYGGSGNCNGSFTPPGGSTQDTSGDNKTDIRNSLTSVGCSTNLLNGKTGWQDNVFEETNRTKMQMYDTKYKDLLNDEVLASFYEGMNESDFADKNNMNGGFKTTRSGCKYMGAAKIMTEATGFLIDTTYIRDHVDKDKDGLLSAKEVGDGMQELLPPGYKVETKRIENPTKEDLDSIKNDTSSLNFVLAKGNDVNGGTHWVEGTGYTTDAEGNTYLKYSGTSVYDDQNNRVYIFGDVPDGSSNVHTVGSIEVYSIVKE